MGKDGADSSESDQTLPVANRLEAFARASFARLGGLRLSMPPFCGCTQERPALLEKSSGCVLQSFIGRPAGLYGWNASETPTIPGPRKPLRDNCTGLATYPGQGDFAWQPSTRIL